MAASSAAVRSQTLTHAIPGATAVLSREEALVYAFRTPSLGNWSYLVASDGQAAIIDPQRDVERLVLAADRLDLRLSYVFETHVHSDYVSGGLRLAHDSGAEIVAPALAGLAFPHRAMDDDERLHVGNITVRCLATPGHSFEHAAWALVAPDERVIAVFSGGSLLRSGSGRADILGQDTADELARLQFTSLRRLAALPDDALVLPTHGGGSVCGTSASSDEGRFTTIAEERAANPYLRASQDAFVTQLIADRPPVPVAFRSIARLNRSGTALIEPPGVPRSLTPQSAARALAAGAWPIDLRDRRTFCAGHLQGALNVAPTESFASYVVALVPHGRPLVLVGDAPPHVLRDIALECYRIGYPVVGVLGGALDAWRESGLSTQAYAAITATELAEDLRTGAPPAILDVRDPAEWREGTLDGSLTISLSALATLPVPIQAGATVTVVCHGGARASIAASYLARLGLAVRPVVEGGVPDVLPVRLPSAV